MSLETVPMMLLHPQPLGIQAGAAAYLVLPHPPLQLGAAADAIVAAHQALMRGEIDTDVPAAWQFYLKAAGGDLVAARLLVEAMSDDASPVEGSGGVREVNRQVHRYNLFALAPSAELFNRLMQELVHPQLHSLLQLTAYAYGMLEHPPVGVDLSGELKAWELATRAADSIERERWEVAKEQLDEAVALSRDVSPLLAASLLGQAAQASLQLGKSLEQVQDELNRAIACAEAAGSPRLLAELYAQLGMLLQQSAGDNRQHLLSAVRAYQLALQAGATIRLHPLVAAEIQNNLALAYLAMPETGSSAQLRTGIAIQAFRQAISGLEAQQHTEAWGRIHMNLANALQYAPSSHPAENLIQAVEIYEQVLQVRTRARDPVAYAWVIYNQANALGHLGMFKVALEKAAEAYKLFHWHEQSEGAEAARELVHAVSERLTAVSGDASLEGLSQELQHGHV